MIMADLFLRLLLWENLWSWLLRALLRICQSDELNIMWAAHYAKVQKCMQGKIGLHFFICGANNVVAHYGKIIEILHGILLRADLAGHGHPTLFDRNWLKWPCFVRGQ